MANNNKSEIEKRDDIESQKAEFFGELQKMRPDLTESKRWTEEDRKKIREKYTPAKVKSGMLSMIPMRCYEFQCQFQKSCPLLKEGLAPGNGDPCPIEQASLITLFEGYVEELDVDVTRMVEVSMVRDLVDQEIQQMRKTWMLSEESFIQDVVAGIDKETGEVITTKGLHQAVFYEDRILKRKEKLLNALAATRESKAKYGKKSKDESQAVSDLLESARQLEFQREKEYRQKLGLSEQDDYILAEIVDEQDLPPSVDDDDDHNKD